MKIPDFTQQGRPSPQPSLGMARYQPTNMGAAMAPGEELAKLSDTVGTVVERENLRIDTLRSEDAWNQLRATQLDLTSGEDGFAQKRGKDAVTQPLLKTYGQRYDDATNQIAAGLTTPRQKELFRQRSEVSGMQFRDELMRHVLKEDSVYQDQTFVGANAVENQLAAQNWNQPAAIALSRERIDGLINARAAAAGWPEEYKLAERNKYLGNLHETVIDQALANKEFVYAEKWFDEHKGDMDSATIDKLAPRVEAGKQKELTNIYTTEFLAVSDSVKALDSLEKRVTGDQTLDDEHKNILIGRIQSRQETLVNRYERQAAQRDRQLMQGITAVNTVTMMGFEPTAAQIEPLLQSAKGTEYEPLVRQMVQTANATRTFRLATPAQQEQMLTELEAGARKDPSKFDVQMISKLKSIKEAQGELLKKDPTTFAIRQGLVATDDPGAAPLDLTAPETLGENLMNRFAISRSMQTRYGAPMKPLTDAEATTLKTWMNEAPAQAKRAYFGKLATVTTNDRVGYRAIMAQLAPDDPVTATAGILAIKNPTASDLMLQGQALLKPDKKADGSPASGKIWPMPTDDAFSKAFVGMERGAYAGHPEARNAAFQSVKAIYAGLSAKVGDTNVAVVNSKRMEQALQLATGGIVKYQGQGAVLPYGMTKGQFEDGMETRIDFLISSGQMPTTMTAGKLKDLPVETIGDGRYRLRAGDGVVVDKTGRPIVLDLNQPIQAPTKAIQPAGYGQRQDGSQKGKGFFGELRRPDGDVSTELSIGVKINGKETEIPLLVPTLTKAEVDSLLAGKEPTREMVQKARDHADKRIKSGKSPFAQDGEQGALK